MSWIVKVWRGQYPKTLKERPKIKPAFQLHHQQAGWARQHVGPLGGRRSRALLRAAVSCGWHGGQLGKGQVQLEFVGPDESGAHLVHDDASDELFDAGHLAESADPAQPILQLWSLQEVKLEATNKGKPERTRIYPWTCVYNVHCTMYRHSASNIRVTPIWLN